MPTIESLTLSTPNDVQAALSGLSISWNPTLGHSDDEHSLYTWVAGRDTDAADLESLKNRGILYVGTDRKGGGRVRDEIKWIEENGFHGHALAMVRSEGRPLSGALVRTDPGLSEASRVALEKVMHRRGLNDAGMQRVLTNFDQLASGEIDTVRIEYLSIRFTMHIGDVGAPVNASGKNAWSVERSESLGPLDDVAFWLAVLATEDIAG